MNKQKLVIVGGGSSGWMTAALLSKLLGSQLEITLIESSQIGIVGVGEASIPPLTLFNNALGINEAEFMAATQGTFKLGIQFENWHQQGERYMHAFGEIGQGLNLSAFAELWAQQLDRQQPHEQQARSLWDWSLNYQVASQDRCGILPQIPNTPIKGLVHAYHFDATAYGQYLKQWSLAQGVRAIDGKVIEVRLCSQTGDIAQIQLEDGQVITGDWFIDCSGFRSLLLGQALNIGYEDWSNYLPCDSAWAVPSQNGDTLKPYTRAIAHTGGWQWQIPLQHRTGNGMVFSQRFWDQQQALDTLMQNLPNEAIAEPRLIRFVTGKRQQTWAKNCVALGLAAGFLEPLESTSIHLVQSGVLRFARLFPQQKFDGRARQAVISEYNRQTQVEFENIRDFLLLHYYLNQRQEPLWQHMRQLQIPDSLANKIELFHRQSYLKTEPDNLFGDMAWLQVLVGQGVLPQASSALTTAIPQADRQGYLQHLKQIYQQTCKGFGSHQSFIAQYCQATKRG